MPRPVGQKNVDVVMRISKQSMGMPWYRALAMAIVMRALADWDNLNKAGKVAQDDYICQYERYKLNEFFTSGWCDALLVGTSYNGETIKELNDGR